MRRLRPGAGQVSIARPAMTVFPVEPGCGELGRRRNNERADKRNKPHFRTFSKYTGLGSLMNPNGRFLAIALRSARVALLESTSIEMGTVFQITADGRRVENGN